MDHLHKGVRQDRFARVGGIPAAILRRVDQGKPHLCFLNRLVFHVRAAELPEDMHVASQDSLASAVDNIETPIKASRHTHYIAVLEIGTTKHLLFK